MPCGSNGATPIEFVETSGDCSLYLLPFPEVAQPTYLSTRIGSFSLVTSPARAAVESASRLARASTQTATDTVEGYDRPLLASAGVGIAFRDLHEAVRRYYESCFA